MASTVRGKFRMGHGERLNPPLNVGLNGILSRASLVEKVSARGMRMSPGGGIIVCALKTGEELVSSSIAIKASASSKSRKSLSSKGVSVGDEVETIGS
ncbi:hypothetical protein Tco_0110647 [Tanacetum coccineum]|uniref:Uncharacterized protein n=1 Tax=Tanacetum coccineum TaxID=301880 RepID=A0ABQ5FJ70_9ASTR